jgi:transcriptional regulator with XRE-family HTH domain
MVTERPGHPHAQSAIARFLDQRIEELRGRRTQREIAAEAGYTRPNILSMLKSGETKVPLDKIPALAKALEADPAHLFRLGMADRWPELASIIDGIFGKQMASANEVAILLTKWRTATSNTDPAPSSQIDAAVDEMLAAVSGTLRSN